MSLNLNAKILPAIGLLLLLYLIFDSGLDNILPVLLNTRLEYVLFSVMIIPLIVYLKGYKWNIIMRAHHLNYSTIYAAKVWLIGLFTGTFTPGRAGDIIRIFYVRGNGTAGKPFSTVLLDRLYDIGALLIISCFGYALIFYWFSATINAIFYGAVLFVLILYIISKKGIVKMILKPIYLRFIPANMKSSFKLNFDDFYSGFNFYLKNKWLVLSVGLLTMILWIVSIIQEYLLIMALNLDAQISIFYLIAISPIVTILTLLPISISGIGPRDLSMIYFFSLVGILPKYAISFSIMLLLLYWEYAVLGGIVWFFFSKNTKVSFKL